MTSRLPGEFEHLFGGLNSLLNLKDTEKIKSADFHDPCPIANDDSLQYRRFFA